MTGKTGNASPDAIDSAIGVNIKKRRRAIGMSQLTLANQIGVTFQQVQKYERGDNRISGSRLVRTAAALGIGVADMVDEETDPLLIEAQELLDVFKSIEDQRQRRALVAMAKIIANLGR